MAMDNIPPEVMKAVPGAAGSFVAMLFIKDTWPRRIAMFLAGSAFSYYGTPWATKFAGLDAGFSGFLLGLFGMAAVAKVLEAVAKLDLGTLVMDWLRKVGGLPAKDKEV